MDDHLSTTQVGWLLGSSSNAVRETIQEKAGRKLSDAELERLIDEVLAMNEERANESMRLVKPPRAGKRARSR
jgi:predicted transcriptional regulator